MSTSQGELPTSNSQIPSRRWPSKKWSADVHESVRNPISSMLAQLTPTSGGFSASQSISCREDCLRVSGVSREPGCPSEMEPVLMTIQLPDDLVIADVRVEERYVRVKDARCAPRVNRIRVPVDTAVSGAQGVLVARESQTGRA